MEIAKAEIGDFISPDGWGGGGAILAKPRAFCSEADMNWQFSMESGNLLGVIYAVNITITSRKVTYHKGKKRYRCRIEFVHDGEPSTVSGGYIFKNIHS